MIDYLFKYSGYVTVTADNSDDALDFAADQLPESAEIELYDEMPHDDAGGDDSER